MHILKKRWTAFILAVLVAASLLTPSSAAGGSAVEAALAASGAMEYGGADSLQYAVWQNGEILLSGHVGNYSRTENRALTGEELYGIGSVSKIYTTAAVMQLVEQGKVLLDAPVTQYLPNFRMKDSRYKDITVRMLLNHSSGLMGSTFDSALLFDDPDRGAAEGLLDQLATQRLKADPGAYSVYCNDGFTLAELMVEAVSRQSFPTYMNQHILEPLHLEDTFSPSDKFEESRLAKTYQGTDPRALPKDCLGVVGAGGLYATAADLAAFGGALTESSLLRQSSLDAMAAPEYQTGIWPEDDLDQLSFGLGWDAVNWYPFCQSGITALVKGGDTLRYHAGLLVIPEYSLSVAVVSSGGVSTYNELAAARIALSLLKEQGIPVDETVPELPAAEPAVMPESLLGKAGYYASTSAQYQIQLSAEGTMSLRYLNASDVPVQVLSYYNDGSFRNTAGTVLLKLVPERNGQLYLYQKGFTQLPGLGILPTSNYAAVMVPENTPSPEALAAWNAAAAQSFVPLHEKYSSQVYLSLATSAAAPQPEHIPGYVGAARIVDSTTALYELQLPGTGGRDGQDLHLSTQGQAAWMEANHTAYLSVSGIPNLFAGTGWSYTTIPSDGCARWYRTGAAAGKIMTVQLPESGGFWVYNANWQLVASSVLWNDSSIPLPADGYVVFAGHSGARFHLRFTA
ncbi:CubicO group peptidase, beta-lactamase class C family [Oscillibacter sp. PC13]|uniref:serine hydrolase domain-containing protein n=1 Tax=Oscillibacter sp. PC13 TaxID=1855299 RepID=UPI0008E94519|nr:serine hydrolase domain-containing protein [Oscillibacter sp. PC13]SFP34915.1 CubicO group peptidase, beta-lactamase class C family [Oscillibacter sp. PC13]